MDLKDAKAGYDALLAEAERKATAGAASAASVFAQVAAHSAAGRHPGFFRSADLEALLSDLGARFVLPSAPVRRRRPGGSPRRRVLHVLTEAYSIGGHTKALYRWIGADSASTHDVAITQQVEPLPPALVDAVAAAGGRIRLLDGVENLIAVARDLRRMADGADFIVLHVHPYDVVPLLAFGADQERPPTLVFNHADHVFWLGESICDCLVNFRRSGARLAAARRGLGPERSALLPLPLLPSSRPDAPGKTEARRILGLPADAPISLTIASEYKLVPNRRADFFALHRPLFDADPEFRMVLVGPSATSAYWMERAAETGGRVHPMGMRSELDLFTAAADVYLDSTPFASQTALLEAVLDGLPAVSWRPYPAESLSAVLASDDVALDDQPVIFHDAAAYLSQVRALLADRSAAEALGRAQANAIATLHWGPAWTDSLERTYEAAALNAADRPAPSAPDQGPSDVDQDLLEFQAGSRRGVAPEVQHFRFLPVRLQIATWARIPKEDRPPLKEFLPLRLRQRVRRAWSGMRR
ncbi:hypothetical protein [Chthonobacter rhizosphaerae]|uniref:hypothetical protein n=1 Tax=Chthonobacter rhizosphaerae TaxID=2735553 RepID=UPI0015EFD2E3|nr:hypothetical protein [Chthonobacter rhizosphaerae]